MGVKGAVQQILASASSGPQALQTEVQDLGCRGLFLEELEGVPWCRDSHRQVGALRDEGCSDGPALGSLKPQGSL